MNFDFTPEQQEFREHIRRYLEAVGGLSCTRKAIEGNVADAAAIWKGLASMGVQAAAISEEHGGLGLGMLELCVAAEEIGRTLAPIPFFSSVCVCAEAIRLYGSQAQKSQWLPHLASGAMIGTWGPAGGRADGRGSVRWSGGRLSGTMSPIVDAMVADLAVVTVSDESNTPALMVCDLRQPGVSRRSVVTIDPSRDAGSITFDGAEAIVLPAASGSAYTTLSNRAAVLLAFEQLGGAEAALSMAREYALSRSAFNRKIGSFQAIKHRLTEMYAYVELARSHCYHGAWAISTGASALPLAAAGARCSSIEAFEYTARENIQIHGGIGITWESDCHLFYRRARLTSLILGPRYDWQDHLVAALQDSSAAV
jgi:acyl-CoA dehydrogenase